MGHLSANRCVTRFVGAQEPDASKVGQVQEQHREEQPVFRQSFSIMRRARAPRSAFVTHSEPRPVGRGAPPPAPMESNTSRSRRFTREDWAGIAFALVRLGFCTYRALTQSIVHDEGFSFQRFVSGPWSNVYSTYDANNHVLNTLLAKLS